MPNLQLEDFLAKTIARAVQLGNVQTKQGPLKTEE